MSPPTELSSTRTDFSRARARTRAHVHCSLFLAQLVQRGLDSSHFFRLERQVKQPSLERGKLREMRGLYSTGTEPPRAEEEDVEEEAELVVVCEWWISSMGDEVSSELGIEGESDIDYTGIHRREYWLAGDIRGTLCCPRDNPAGVPFSRGKNQLP